MKSFQLITADIDVLKTIFTVSTGKASDPKSDEDRILLSSSGSTTRACTLLRLLFVD